MTETGIVLFVYNRPTHTKRVLEGLQANGVEELYIFADGPRSDNDVDAVQTVRSIVNDIDWCETHVEERKTNWGLAENTIDGIDRMFANHERVIVVEDDDFPAPDFVDFMQACLDEYEHNQRVMHVSGYSPPIEIPDWCDDDVYFTYRDSTWAWATWERAWEQYQREPGVARQRIQADELQLKRELDRAGRDVLPMLKSALRGQIDSWSIWWIWSILQNDGICVNPVRSRIKPIGHDGSGTHSAATDKYAVDIDERLLNDGLKFPEEIEPNETINRMYNDFNDPPAKQLWRWELRTIVNTVSRSVRQRLPGT